jgi:hypothetical protein
MEFVVHADQHGLNTLLEVDDLSRVTQLNPCHVFARRR